MRSAMILINLADSQAYVSLGLAHRSFCWFDHVPAKIFNTMNTPGNVVMGKLTLQINILLKLINTSDSSTKHCKGNLYGSTRP